MSRVQIARLKDYFGVFVFLFYYKSHVAWVTVKDFSKEQHRFRCNECFPTVQAVINLCPCNCGIKINMQRPETWLRQGTFCSGIFHIFYGHCIIVFWKVSQVIYSCSCDIRIPSSNIFVTNLFNEETAYSDYFKKTPQSCVTFTLSHLSHSCVCICLFFIVTFKNIRYK